MRMTTIDRYLSWRMIVALVKALCALVFLYVLLDLLTHRRDNIMKHDIPWDVVLAYYVAYVPWVVGQVAPLALLVSALLVLGDAAQNNEVTAALASGISLRKFARMPILVALLFASSMFFMEETIGAPATLRAKDIEYDYFARNPDSKREGVTWGSLSGSWTCHILKFNRLANTGETVFMHSIRDDAIEHIEARRIFWDETAGKWMIEDGHWLVLEPNAALKRSQDRVTQREAPFAESPDQLFAMAKAPETMTASELGSVIRYASRHQIPSVRLRVDYYSKFSRPALVFVMIWLAVPFAMRLRRGGLAISFGASIAIALVYLVVYSIGITMGNAGRLDPVTAAWIANVVFLMGGVILYLKTPT